MVSRTEIDLMTEQEVNAELSAALSFKSCVLKSNYTKCLSVISRLIDKHHVTVEWYPTTCGVEYKDGKFTPIGVEVWAARTAEYPNVVFNSESRVLCAAKAILFTITNPR